MSTRNHNERCKNCGYCPACGRSDRYWGGPYWYPAPTIYPNYPITVWNGTTNHGTNSTAAQFTYTLT